MRITPVTVQCKEFYFASLCLSYVYCFVFGVLCVFVVINIIIAYLVRNKLSCLEFKLPVQILKIQSHSFYQIGN